jgi:hypothetical protein
MAMYTAPVKLWLTEDRKRVVEDGDPEMAHLFLAAGHQIPEEEAIKFGLVKAAAPVADKKATKPADKSVKKPADKAKE